MPVARVGDISLYHEVHGQGPNLVLIEGIGFYTWMWYRQVPAFAPLFRTLIYDNRGVGRSDKPPGPYNHIQNADDLASLLDHLDWDRTHVVGVSMGGYIAQEFALKYPGRLNRLVLAVTAFGGPNMVPVSREALAYLLPGPEVSPEDHIRGGTAFAYGDPTWPDRNREEFEQIIRWRLELQQPAEAKVAQAMAAQTFNTEDRLGEIAAPTLVITASRDRIVSPRNAELLAARIPHARLDIIEGAGHHVFYEAAERFNRDIIAFLQEGDDVGRA
jgi:pimeloyl-ACP methyl ester carboxylesterase